MNIPCFPRFILGLFLTSFSGLFLTGCATPAKPAAMVPEAFNLEKRHSFSVRVTASVMEESVEKGILRGPELAEAISEAIRRSGLFATVKSEGADYFLEVRITGATIWNWNQLECPITLRSAWILTRASDSQVLTTEFIQAENRVTVGKAIVGSTRARLSVEGATKKLIQSGLERLSRSNP